MKGMKACLIIDNKCGGKWTYKVYFLNVRFAGEIHHQGKDGTRIWMTDEAGGEGYIGEIAAGSRQSGLSMEGEFITVDSVHASQTILTNLRALIADGNIEHPDAVKHLIAYDPLTRTFKYIINPEHN